MGVFLIVAVVTMSGDNDKLAERLNLGEAASGRSGADSRAVNSRRRLSLGAWSSAAQRARIASYRTGGKFWYLPRPANYQWAAPSNCTYSQKNRPDGSVLHDSDTGRVYVAIGNLLYHITSCY